ncbi:MAG TPA: hypothetical protein VMF88_01235 [Bacteroidota bacterium]|nr:hypothetical protein [Bacteroidota bacterium]
MRSSLKIFLLLAAFVSVAQAQEQSSLVNFGHLKHLTEKIDFYGDTVSIVHIYSNYPDFNWVDAKESGPEGIACVDDAARAAVVMLRYYELHRDASALEDARSLLKFVSAMETDDGEFYNFIFADHTINRTGTTSIKSFGWWAARGVWSMSMGYRIFKNIDTAFAAKLKTGVMRALPHIDALLKNYGKEKTKGGFRIPEWLVYESGADVSSELLLGLAEWYRASDDPKVKEYIVRIADGLMVMQDGDLDSFPYGLHRSWETMWHMWGNGQTEALASAGMLLNDSTMIQSAHREAHGFYSRLLIKGFMKEIDVARPDSNFQREQIAYGVRPITAGLLRLYDATKNETYLTMAGLAASWLFGNNVAHQQMYDPASGRCADGIKESLTVNKNSGAESTIEALHTLIEVENYPGAVKYLRYKKIKEESRDHYLGATFSNAEGDELTLGINTRIGALMLTEGKGKIVQ